MVNKRGLELSINFIVMLIIAVVIFTFSIVMARKFFSQTNDLKDQISDQTKEQIRSMLLAQNAQIAIFPESIVIERGENAIVGVGILNTGVAAQFGLVVNCKLIKPDGSPGPNCDGVRAFYDESFVEITKNADEVIQVNFIVDKEAPSGKYVFDIQPKKRSDVTASAVPYGFGTYKVYVSVEN